MMGQDLVTFLLIIAVLAIVLAAMAKNESGEG